MARLYTRREAHSRRLTFKVFAGMFDFVGTVASAIIIIVCLVLMIQLARWIIADFDGSFGTLLKMLEEAVAGK